MFKLTQTKVFFLIAIAISFFAVSTKAGVLDDRYNCTADTGDKCNNKGICHIKGFCICRAEYYGQKCDKDFNMSGGVTGPIIFFLVIAWIIVPCVCFAGILACFNDSN